MNSGRRLRLEQGECKHSPCPSCNEPLTTRTALAPDVQLILRRRWCPDELVDFHLVIQTSDTTGWRDVARFLGRALELPPQADVMEPTTGDDQGVRPHRSA